MMSRSWALAALMLVFLCAPAAAAPSTVQLRVEGKQATLFEGPVTTDAKAIRKGSSGPHDCDGTFASNGTTQPGTTTPSTAPPGPTALTALDDGYPEWAGEFNPGFKDYLVTRIGQDTGSSQSEYWGLVRNLQPSLVGACQAQVGAGDEVLWALGDVFTQPLLKLSGPQAATQGQAVEVKVVNGKDGSPVAGAQVGGATTGADGVARVSFDSPGAKRLKAERSGAIRSAALSIAVAVASEQAAATTQGAPVLAADRGAPRVTLASPRSGARYRRGPRLLAGSVTDDGGIHQAYFRLRRTARGGCSWYSAKRERFTGSGSCRRARFNRVGDARAFSYLLPQRLASGRYLLEIKALDRALNVSTRRVGFRVR